MHTNPKENRTCMTALIRQFEHKGYQCKEMKEDDSTLLILTYERKNADLLSQVVGENYKSLLKPN